MGPVSKWYSDLIPKMRKFMEKSGNAEIYVVRTVEPISEHFVIRGWYKTPKAAAAHAVEPRKPELAKAQAVLDELELWIKHRQNE